MTKLNISIDIPLHKLSDRLLPYVDWSCVHQNDILALPKDKLKYVSTDHLCGAIGSGVSMLPDDDLLYVIARDVGILAEKYDYTTDSRLEAFLHLYCSYDFVKKYARQIYTMCEMQSHSIARAKSVILTYGLLDISKLVGNGFFDVRWTTLNSTRVPMEHRYNILKSGAYMAYVAEFDCELEEMTPVLYTEQLDSLPFITCAPTVFDDYALYYILNDRKKDYSWIENRNDIAWNELIDLYLDMTISYQLLERFWAYFLNNGNFSFDDYEERIISKKTNRSKFAAEDFL